MFQNALEKSQQSKPPGVTAEMMKSRKRTYSSQDAVELNRKLSIAANKIMKIQVENETNNIELKDRINELTKMKENLNQNLYVQQKQIESLEGDIGDNLRIREDITRKVINTREISVAIEEHTKAIESALSSCQEDRKVLCDSYHKAAEFINKLKEDQVNIENKYINEVSTLKAQLENEIKHNNEQNNNWYEAKTKLERTIEKLQDQSKFQTETILSLNREKEKSLMHIKILENEIGNHKKVIQSIESNYNEEKQKLINEKSTISVSLQDCEKQLSQREKELESLRMAKINQELDIQHVKNDNFELNQALEKSEEEMSKITTTFNDLKIKLDIIVLERDNAYNHLTTLNDQLSEQKRQIEEMESKSNGLLNKNNDLELKIIQLKQNFEAEENNWKLEIEKAKIDINEKLNKELNDSKLKLAALETELGNKSKLNTTLMENLKNCKDQIAKNDRNLEDIMKDRENFKNEVIILKNVVSNKNEDINKLNEQLKLKCQELNRKFESEKTKPKKVQSKTETTQTEELESTHKETADDNHEETNRFYTSTQKKETNKTQMINEEYEGTFSDSSMDTTFDKYTPSHFYQSHNINNSILNKRLSPVMGKAKTMNLDEEITSSDQKIYKKPITYKSKNKRTK